VFPKAESALKFFPCSKRAGDSGSIKTANEVKKMRQTLLNRISVTLVLIFVMAAIGFSITRTRTVDAQDAVAQGQNIFSNNCAVCHHVESTRALLGPGLADLFERPELPISRRPVTEENVKRQLTDPVRTMPSFSDLLSEDEMEAVVEYLKTI
jgi:mono/diheme cytochrome c family protein